MCYKVKILFYIEELNKKAHIPRDFVHDAGKAWVCNLFCSLPPIECLLLGYFPDVFWVTTKFFITYLWLSNSFSLRVASGALTVIGLFDTSSEVGTLMGLLLLL